MATTDEIKSRLDIIDIISESVTLKRSGRNYAGFCPFHSNTRTPAFYVFPETQTWRCFGACADGGDLFSFVMKKEGWDFKEALAKMAERAGVELQPVVQANKAQKVAHGKKQALLTAAADYFHMLLLYAPEAEFARRYVTNRGLDEETNEAYKLGFALDSWHACRNHFNEQGYSDQELLDVGLLTENPDKGTRYDRFRNRFMIPIRNVEGHVVGFGARTLDPDGIPKYLNSPQTDLFDKSHLLFGLDMAKRHIREARQVVIVEGYLDVMQAWQAGFRNVVAQMGTALTEHHLNLLKRYTKQFVLALDADAAGAKATLRGLEVARETLDKEVEIQFDAHGLVRHEGRIKADIRVVTLPEGKDPDNIIQENPAQWPILLEQAKPVVEYVIGVAVQGLDLQDAKAKTAVAQQVIPLIKDIAEPVERDHYWQLLARKLVVDERSLRRVPMPQKRTYQSPRPTAQQPRKPASQPMLKTRKTAVVGSGPIFVEMREINYLRHCLQYPQLIHQINQRLLQLKQTIVIDKEFSLLEDQVLFQELSLQRGRFVTIAELCDSLDVALQERVQALLTLPVTPESELERLPDKLTLSILDWRKEKFERLSRLAEPLFDRAQNQTDVDSQEILEQQNALRLNLFNVNKARGELLALKRASR